MAAFSEENQLATWLWCLLDILHYQLSLAFSCTVDNLHIAYWYFDTINNWVRS